MLSCCPLFHECSVHPGAACVQVPSAYTGAGVNVSIHHLLSEHFANRPIPHPRDLLRARHLKYLLVFWWRFCHVPSAKWSHSTVDSTSLFEPKGIILVIPLQTSSLSGRVYLGNWKVLKIAFHLFLEDTETGSYIAQTGLRLPSSWGWP